MKHLDAHVGATGHLDVAERITATLNFAELVGLPVKARRLLHQEAITAPYELVWGEDGLIDRIYLTKRTTTFTGQIVSREIYEILNDRDRRDFNYPDPPEVTEYETPIQYLSSVQTIKFDFVITSVPDESELIMNLRVKDVFASLMDRCTGQHRWAGGEMYTGVCSGAVVALSTDFDSQMYICNYGRDRVVVNKLKLGLIVEVTDDETASGLLIALHSKIISGLHEKQPKPKAEEPKPKRNFIQRLFGKREKT